MNKIILKIEFLSDKSLSMTFLYIDKRLMTQKEHDFVYFNSDAYDFVIYSRKGIKRGINSLRLPGGDRYEKNMKAYFEFIDEHDMYNWLKKFHRTLEELNNKYTPFVKDINYSKRPKKLMMSGEYWVL